MEQNIYIAAAAKLLQSCPTLCDPIDGSPPGSPVPGILQARTLECVASSFSNARKWKLKMKLLNRARLLATPWIAAYQAPPSMEVSRQEYWIGMPLPSPVVYAFAVKLKKKLLPRPGSRSFHFDFLMNFIISWYSWFVIIKFRVKEIEWLVQSYINNVIETDHA